MAATLAICTRNRPADLQRALMSVASANPHVEELIVIDQSDHVTPIEAALGCDVRHVPSTSRGLSRARNEALALAAGDIVCFTDDDCLLQPGAIEQIAAMFDSDPRLGVVFGTVYAPRSVNEAGFTPTYRPPRRAVLRGRLSKLRDDGIGACMSVRRDIALALGGFDARLGAGAEFASYEDGDFAYRVLKGGYALGHLPEARVLHEGLKPWHDGPRFMYETYRAIGAAYGLHVRDGDPVALILLLRQAGVLLARAPRQLVLRRPVGWTVLRGLIAGALYACLRPKPLGAWPVNSP
jgi:GT2 family glycosyltransferase